MMNKRPQIWKLGANFLLGASLLGCQANLLGVLKQQATPADASTVATPASDLPRIDLVSKVSSGQAVGQLDIGIRWPQRARSVQALPNSANTVRLRIYEQATSDPCFDELIARPTDMNGPGSVVKSYSLKKNTAYNVEVKAYAEQKASVNADSVAIAYTAAPQTVTLAANENKNLSLHLVALNQPALEAVGYAGGSGADLLIRGQGFGSDPAQIEVFQQRGANDWDRTDLSAQIQSMSDTAISLKLPANFSGSGDLVVRRDGVKATGAATISSLNSIELIATQFKNFGGKNLVIAGKAFSVSALGHAWNGGNLDFPDLSYSIKVADVDHGGADVTGSVLSNGQFTLPTEGHFQIKYSSGTLNSTLDVYGATLHWSAAAPEPILAAVPYYLSNSLSYNWNSNSGLLPLVDYTLTSGADTVYLEGTDFNWTYEPSGVVAYDAAYGYQSNKIRFKGGQTAGVSLVTGTLKYDASKAFVTALENVKIASLDVLEDTNKGVWPENLVAIPGGGLTLSVGQTARLRLKTVSLTDESSLNPDWTFNQGLAWTSRKLDGTSGNSIAMVVPENDVGYAVVTAKVAGTVEIQLRYTTETDASKIRKITLTIQ